MTLLLFAAPARGDEPMVERVAAMARASLPPGFAVAEVTLPPSLAQAEGAVMLDWRTAPRLGVMNVRVEVRGPRSACGWARLRLTLPAPVVAHDTVKPPPIARGSEVSVIVRRGAVTVAASGHLERPARVGEDAAVRLDSTHQLVSGRLTDSHTLVNEGAAQ